MNFHQLDESIIECPRGIFADVEENKPSLIRTSVSKISQNSSKYLLKKQKEYKIERAGDSKSR